MEPRLMREPEARQYLGGLSHGRLFQLRQEGLIPVLKVGRSVFYDRVALDEVIDKLREQSDNEA